MNDILYDVPISAVYQLESNKVRGLGSLVHFCVANQEAWFEIVFSSRTVDTV